MTASRLVLLLSLAAAGAARAAGPFDGVWVADLGAQKEADHTDVYLVKDGQYRCDSCRPPRAYPADGKGRGVNDPGVTSESVTVTGPRTIVTHMVEPDMVREVTMTADPDDKTATYVALDQWPGLDHRLKTVFKARRTVAGPPGSHPVSGSWKAIGYTEVPEEYRSVELHEAAGSLTSRQFRGGHFTAAFGGPPVTVQGSENDQVQVAVKRTGPRSFSETYLFGGKAVSERTFAFFADGRSMRQVTTDLHPREVFASTYYRK